MNHEAKLSVLDRIKMAKNEEELGIAVEAGSLCKEDASPETVRKWNIAVAKRKAVFGEHPLPEGTAVASA